MKYQRYLDISQAQTLESFKASLLSFANDRGFGLATAALLIDRPGRTSLALGISNTPDAFASSFKSDDEAARDPVYQRLKTLTVPFMYDQSVYVSEGAGDLWEEQAPFGYRTGIAVALHLPMHRHFVMGLDRDEPLPKKTAPLTRMFADLVFLAVHAQECATRLLLPDGDESDGASTPRLTSREREILQWTMQGKSAWDIGQILAISEHTVNFHVRSCLKKLGAHSKHQAVLKAITLGLI